jgi:hypothetical protein
MKWYNKALHFFIAGSFILVTITFVLLAVFKIGESGAEENYSGVSAKKCAFAYADQIENRSILDCYARVDGVLSTFEKNLPISSKEDFTIDPVNPSVSMETLNASKIWKSKVSSVSIPHQKYDNVAEPSFASNGTLVLYAGNHFAARSLGANEWEYVDPSFDLKGLQEVNTTDANFSRLVTPIFKADQHVEYDPVRKMFLWVRQSEQVFIGGGVSNIDRLAVSRDLDHWVVYDLISIDVLNQAGLIEPVFDYPDTVLTDKYLYMTTSVYDDNAKYGMVFRFSLDDLSDSIDQPAGDRTAINYEFVLDRNVETIAPVDGASNPMYFGSHLPRNNTIMRIYTWFDDSPSLNSTDVEITPWNNIKNRAACTNPDRWWCNANTSSRVTSAWMSENTVNFMWNAILSYNRGDSWLPYIDSATLYVNESLGYERRYHLADPNNFWIYGAASPSKAGDLGVSAFYVDTSAPNSTAQPYMNFAFGVFNNTENTWEMMPILNSSAPLPVLNEERNKDYNFGDFLTTKAHLVNDGIYSWDSGGYIIVGPNYDDVEPYYIKIKN